MVRNVADEILKWNVKSRKNLYDEVMITFAIRRRRKKSLYILS